MVFARTPLFGFRQGAVGAVGNSPPACAGTPTAPAQVLPAFSFFDSPFQLCSPKQGGNFIFEKNVEFLEFFGFTLRFRTF